MVEQVLRQYDSSVSNSARLFVFGLVHQSVRALPNLAYDLKPLENSIRDACMPSNGEEMPAWSVEHRLC